MPAREPAMPVRDISEPPSRSGRPLTLAIVAIAAMALSAPFIARAALAVLAVESQTPMEWVPPDFPARAEYDRFAAEFGSGNVVVATWPGCTLGAPAVARVVEAAVADDRTSDSRGRPWFASVTDGGSVVSQLVEPPLGLDREEAIDRLTGMLVGPDRRTTCIVFACTPEGVADRRRAVGWIRDTIRRTATTDESAIHLAGPVVDHAAVDAASKESLERFAPAAAALVLLLTWWSLGSFRYAVVVFGVAMWCVGLSFATLWLWGDRMNAVLIVMPALVLVLGVSAGIHLVNYLVEAAAESAEDVARRAVRLGWQPCLLSAGTTAVGLASLVVSELEPIRTFGFHAAIAVMATLLAAFAVLPGLFARWPARRAPTTADPAGGVHSGPVRGVIAHATPITVAFLAVIAATAAGIPGIRTSVRIDTLFRPQSRVIRDYEAVERAIGPLVPIEVVLAFGGPDDSPKPYKRLELVERVGERLIAATGAERVMSAASFAPEKRSGSFVGRASRITAARTLARDLAALDDMRYVRDTPEGQLWRVTARISALDDVDYGRLLDSVRAEVMPLIEPEGDAPAEVRAIFTGAMPVVHGIQNTLLSDLFTSFLSACGIISVVMMLTQRGVLAGLVAMVSNVFPMILLFGFLGWTRVPLDIGSVMTASIALGMAIDGTLHFLTFFGRSRRGGASLAEAVTGAYGHASGALVQSSLVCGLGILVFALSSFAPTSRFACMLALLVTAALAGDLILLPAMLAGPAGRWFGRPRGPAPDASASAEPELGAETEVATLRLPI